MKKNIKNLSVRKKIILIVAVNVFFLLALGVFVFIKLNSINQERVAISNYQKVLNEQNDARVYIDKVQLIIQQKVILSNNKVSELTKDDFREFVKINTQSIISALPLFTHVEDIRALNNYKSILIDYFEEANELLYKGKVLSGNNIQKLKIKHNAVIEKSNVIAKILKEQISASEYRAKESIFNIKFVLIVIVLLLLSVIVFISLYLIKTIVDPIVTSQKILSDLASGKITETTIIEGEDETALMQKSLNSVVENLSNIQEFVNEVGNGNFETRINVFNNQGDIFESLNKMKNDLKNTAIEDKKRNWATEGMAKFGDILRSNNEGILVLSDSIISNLVKYLKASQGALFLINESNENDVFLEMKACYAWDKKKYKNIRFNLGEGLVGQAWQENCTVYITDVPKDFVRITSGLGDANPTSFLIVPLLVNDKVYGIIEIASFNIFEEFEKEFVEKLAESIASTLASSKANEQTKVLLNQAQDQAEQMKQVEEEMRQNMEEMEATQEEMERQGRFVAQKSREMNSIIDAISETDDGFGFIEFTPRGEVITATDNFLKAVKFSLKELVGKHHNALVPEDIKYSEEYQNFWSDLASNIPKSGVYKRIDSNGSVIWIQAIYKPIVSEEGKVVKVVKFASDVTNKISQQAEVDAQNDIINSVAIVSKTDLKGNITYVNGQFLKWSKYSKEEVMGKNHRILKSGDQDDQIFVDMWKTISSGNIFRGEIKNKAKDGSFYWVDAIIAPVLDDKGKPKEYIAQRFVINEQKEKEAEMLRLIDEYKGEKK